jgi:hypothetical protein
MQKSLPSGPNTDDPHACKVYSEPTFPDIFVDADIREFYEERATVRHRLSLRHPAQTQGFGLI